MNNFSCKGCPTRTPGCHGYCEKYLKEKAEYEALKEKHTKENLLRGNLEEQRFRAVQKAYRHHRKKIGNGKG